jgi:Na+/proline symporter
VFPGLRNADEASFIALARVVMPVGMMGLLVSGIFAATMSSMDSGLNKNAGIFIRNCYQPLFRPAETDQHYLRVGKIATIVLGVIVILVALEFSKLKELNLFLQMQRVSILVAVPITVPLLLGLIIKRTPPWSAWSTVLVGFFCSMFISDALTPEWAAAKFGVTLDAASREYWTQGIQFFGNVVIAAGWFVATSLFWNRTSPEYRAAIETFFARLKTPVDFAKEEGAHNANDPQQQAAIGWLSIAYGAFVTLLALIPKSLAGRFAFIGCGSVVLVIGAMLVFSSRQRPVPS